MRKLEKPIVMDPVSLVAHLEDKGKGNSNIHLNIYLSGLTKEQTKPRVKVCVPGQ